MKEDFYKSLEQLQISKQPLTRRGHIYHPKISSQRRKRSRKLYQRIRSLPAELRNAIYHEVLYRKLVPHTALDIATFQEPLFALLEDDGDYRTYAREIFYLNSTFRITTPVFSMSGWPRMVGKLGIWAQYLRHITFTLPADNHTFFIGYDLVLDDKTESVTIKREGLGCPICRREEEDRQVCEPGCESFNERLRVRHVACDLDVEEGMLGSNDARYGSALLDCCGRLFWSVPRLTEAGNCYRCRGLKLRY